MLIVGLGCRYAVRAEYGRITLLLYLGQIHDDIEAHYLIKFNLSLIVA